MGFRTTISPFSYLYFHCLSYNNKDSIGKHNHKLYVNSGMPIVFFFAETQGQREVYSAMLRELAKEFRMRVVFVFIDWYK